jgi:hypothetical protein
VLDWAPPFAAGAPPVAALAPAAPDESSALFVAHDIAPHASNENTSVVRNVDRSILESLRRIAEGLQQNQCRDETLAQCSEVPAASASSSLEATDSFALN